VVAETSGEFMEETPRVDLQRKGQFWTPEWVARAMAAYAVPPWCNQVFDPAVGAGALLIAAKHIHKNGNFRVAGIEFHPEVLYLARKEGLSDIDMGGICIGDYLAQRDLAPQEAILCNPPYLRHHKISDAVKTTVRFDLERWLGAKLDGRLGLHGYFLLRSLQQLKPGGRLAYITSADLYEGKSAKAMWTAIRSRFCIDGIIVFESTATPFPGVDTNPVICLISAEASKPTYTYVRVLKSGAKSLEKVSARITEEDGLVENGELRIEKRQVDPSLDFGLARPRVMADGETVPLGRLIRCVRGIATGANDFFLLTEEEIGRRNLPKKFFVRAIGRTRDVLSEEISIEVLEELEQRGRSTWLLNLRGRHKEDLPVSVLEYLKEGEKRGLSERPLIKQRRIWYWTEHRDPSPFLFAYLGRRNVRFLRNRDRIQALTGFLYVYPQPGYSSPSAVNALWECMKKPEFLKYLELVAKTYGGGALKVEPRALERAPIPMDSIRPLMRFRHPSSEVQLEERMLVSAAEGG